MNTCDKLMGYRNIYPLKKSIGFMAIILLSIIIRAFNCIQVMINFKLLDNSYFVTFCYLYSVICIDLSSFKASGVIYLLRNRLKILRKRFAENRIPVNIVGNYEIKRNLKLVRKCIFNYYHLLNAFDNINMEMQLVVIKTNI